MDEFKTINVEGVGPLRFPSDMPDEQIRMVIERDFGPRRNMSTMDKVLDSPIGGVIRGIRDPLDAGAQLLSRGVESLATTVAPNSSFADWAKKERQNVEEINRQAENVYQQNWRRGKMQGIDGGRLVGNIAATLPLAAVAPITAEATVPAILGRGAIQGSTAAVLSQPVYQTQNAPRNLSDLVTGEGDDSASFWKEKGQQALWGAGFGAGGSVVADKIGKVIQGASRANPAAYTTPNTSATASVNVTANPTAKVSGGGSILGQVGDDPTSALTRSQKDLLERGSELGFRNTPGQASGSRSLQQMEARMESSPWTSGPFNTLKTNNQQALNRAVARGIGETADTLDSAVLAQADTRLGQIFEKVADKVPKAVIGDDIATKLSGVEQEFAGVLNKPLLDNGLVKRVFDIAAKGETTGAELRSLSSKLGRSAKNQMRNDPEQGLALFQVKDIVDDIVSQNLDDATREAFNAARTQYRNFMTLLSRQNVVNPATGNVSGPNLASALMSRDKRGYTLGNNTSDMYDAARWAQAFKPIVGDSGTATRSMQMGPMDALLSIPTNIASRAYVSQPSVGLARLNQNGLLPNAYGDAIARAMRQAGPAVSTQTGFGLLNEEDVKPFRIDIRGVGRRY